MRRRLHPGDRALVQQAYRDAVETAVTRTIEFRILRINDRQVRYVRAEAEIVLDHDQRPIKIVGTLQDNTEQKLVELALRESEEKFRNIR